MSGEEVAPLSVAQEALWYATMLAPGQCLYNETISFRKDGPFDARAFRRAFNAVVARHEAWRTTFDRVDGEPVQVVHPPPSFDLPVADLSRLAPDEARRRAVHVVGELSRVPYDLRRGPLIRPRLFRFPGDQHRLYLALHHLVFDGVSLYRIVLFELIALYDAFRTGDEPGLAEPVRYADYARWEQEWIDGPRARRRLAHWRQRLDPMPALELPLDRPRPAAPGHRGGVLSLSVPRDVVECLRAVADDAHASLFQVLAATWALLLHRQSGQRDVVFATPADLRQRSEFADVLGYCLTPVVLRVDVGDDPSFADLVARMRNEVLDALDNLVPFERVVRELPGAAASNVNPVYQTMLVLEPKTPAPEPSWSIHQMESELGDVVGVSRLDLELRLDERPEGELDGRLLYDRDVFERETVRRMAERWLRLVWAVAAEPALTGSRIPLLSADEERRQLVEWNATTTDSPRETVHGLVRAWARRHPDAPAVSAGGRSADYGKLVVRAAEVARRLPAAGARSGDVVALTCEPSVALVAAALGVLQIGASCLLLDPELPGERRDQMVAAAKATTVLDPHALAALLARGPHGGPAADVPPDAVCCVQCAPHAVAVRHAAVANVAGALGADLGIGPTATVLSLPSDLCRRPTLPLWVPLMTGARVVVAPREAATDGAHLSRVIAEEGVSHLHARPSTWRALIETGLKPARGLSAITGEERLTRELADQILERCRVLWNGYDGAEMAGPATMGRVATSGPVTIGRPLPNTRAYVFDRHDAPVPVGIVGELAIAGDGAPPAATAQRTGRRARWLADGQLELVA